jgi:hypothetical protein
MNGADLLLGTLILAPIVAWLLFGRKRKEKDNDENM